MDDGGKGFKQDGAADGHGHLTSVELALNNEPIGISFDSEGDNVEKDINTDDDDAGSSSDFEIAEYCDVSKQLMSSILSKGEQSDKVKSDVYEFSEHCDKPFQSYQHQRDDSRGKVVKKCCVMDCLNQNLPPKIHDKANDILKKSKAEKKQFLLNHLIKQEELDVRTDGFQFFGLFFCKRSFVRVFGVSDYLVSEACKAFEMGQTEFSSHGNTLGMKETESTLGFIIWMKQHAVNYGNQAPDEETIVLPACFKQKDLFQQYEEECPCPRVARSTFYRLFNVKFGAYREDKSLPHIRISSYSTHSKCDTCLLLEKYQKSCKKEEERELVKSMMQRHKQTYQKSYQAIQEKRFLALSDPDHYLHLQVDDMDNTKSMIPQSPATGKALAGMFKMPTKVTGTIIWSGHYPQTRKVGFLLNHNQFEQGGSKLVSILYKLLKNAVDDFGGELPKHLTINLDNCWRFVILK